MKGDVLCHGVFDILHYGHLYHLKQAAKHRGPGGYLIVSLVGDQFAVKNGRAPLYDENQRKEMLESLRVVDLVEITTGVGPFEHLRRHRPEIYCRGADYFDKQDSMPESHLLKELGIKVVITDSHPIHTSDIRKVVRIAP